MKYLLVSRAAWVRAQCGKNSGIEGVDEAVVIQVLPTSHPPHFISHWDELWSGTEKKTACWRRKRKLQSRN
jgi:hypothetical protein